MKNNKNYNWKNKKIKNGLISANTTKKIIIKAISLLQLFKLVKRSALIFSTFLLELKYDKVATYQLSSRLGKS